MSDPLLYEQEDHVVVLTLNQFPDRWYFFRYPRN